MDTEYTVSSLRETSVIAKAFAVEILKTKPKEEAVVIGFVGELGAGKTTFIKSLVRQLGVSKRVTSPTFLVIRRYSLPKKEKYKNVFHIDAYRVGGRDLGGLGFQELVSDSKNIVLVEWADRVNGILPNSIIWIKLKYGKSKNERHITFNRR